MFIRASLCFALSLLACPLFGAGRGGLVAENNWGSWTLQGPGVADSVYVLIVDQPFFSEQPCSALVGAMKRNAAEPLSRHAFVHYNLSCAPKAERVSVRFEIIAEPWSAANVDAFQSTLAEVQKKSAHVVPIEFHGVKGIRNLGQVSVERGQAGRPVFVGPFVKQYRSYVAFLNDFEMENQLLFREPSFAPIRRYFHGKLGAERSMTFDEAVIGATRISTDYRPRFQLADGREQRVGPWIGNLRLCTRPGTPCR